MKPNFLKYGFAIENKGETPAWFKQVHGKTVLDLDQAELTPTPSEADAGFTRLPGKEIYAFTADCLPVLLHGPDASFPVAAIHAGWRGALRGVVRETVTALAAPREKLSAILGPCIGVCCFEIQSDFVQTFAETGQDITPYLQQRGEKRFCDLVRFVVDTQLSGLASVDTSAHRCTVCSQPALPSYRRNGKADPMIRSFICLN
jgi:polyphenol oxidase